MSFYLMHRGWMENPVFKDEPFCERMAWLWMIQEASFEPHKVRYHNRMIDVGRGQYPTSYRKLKDIFQWGNERVKRFLTLLVNESMILLETGTGFLVITICNYEKYQKPSKITGTHAGTASGTDTGTHAGTNIKKEKELKELKERKNISPKPKIDFDFDLMDWKGIQENLFQKWQEAYPAIDIAKQLKEAGVWLIANPKNKKSNYARFLNNWFSKQQDRSGHIASNFKSFEQKAKDKTDLAIQEAEKRYANPS